MKVLLVLAAAVGLTACGSASRPPEKTEWFTDIAATAGVHFHHNPKAEGKFYMPEIMGSGCVLFDFDNDGDLDVFLVQSSGPHRLYRNNGNASFSEIPNAGGILNRSLYGMGVATADFDNDGFLDLLITGFGGNGNALYRNNKGNGTFTEVTPASPDLALMDRWSTSAAFLDYDRDGWLDLVILNYIDYSIRANKACSAPTGELDYCTPRVYQPLPAHLFHNDKGRGFQRVAAAFDKATGPGLGVVQIDANQDGWPDLFIANDSMANHLWINQRDGTFKEQALETGLAYGEEGLAKAGMGVAAGDYDNDGDEDLLVLNLMREGATLFRNDGPSRGFSDASQASGIHALTLPWTGFGVAWQDFDRDGLQDLFLANGAVTRREDQRGQPYPFSERNLVLQQRPAGLFSEIPYPQYGIARGAAFGDIDNDGDIDVLLNMNNGPARLLRNNSANGNWIAVHGLKEGSRVELMAGGQQTRYVRSSGSYLSASPSIAHFGVGAVTSVESITVKDPNGQVLHFVRNPALNRAVRISR
jgi:enediyne biosynthesis protein E4